MQFCIHKCEMLFVVCSVFHCARCQHKIAWVSGLLISPLVQLPQAVSIELDNVSTATTCVIAHGDRDKMATIWQTCFILNFSDCRLPRTCGKQMHLRPRHNGRNFQDEIFKSIFFDENVKISTRMSLTFVPKGSINNNPAWVQMMTRRRPGDKPLPESIMGSVLTHICIAWPQWSKNKKPLYQRFKCQ